MTCYTTQAKCSAICGSCVESSQITIMSQSQTSKLFCCQDTQIKNDPLTIIIIVASICAVIIIAILIAVILVKRQKIQQRAQLQETNVMQIQTPTFVLQPPNIEPPQFPTVDIVVESTMQKYPEVPKFYM